MGLFDLFRKKSRDDDGGDEELADDEEWEYDWSEVPADAVALVREGHNIPKDEEMLAVLRAEAPDCVALPRRGLNQMRWWRQDEWVPDGMRTVARALRTELEIDPEKCNWKIVKDDRGARVGIVFLRK